MSSTTTLYCSGLEADRKFQIRLIQEGVEKVLFPYMDGSAITTTDALVANQSYDFVRTSGPSEVIQIPYIFDPSDAFVQ